ncbi:tape measure protein [Salinicola lusitanus]|uniref:tape measure protein n=1 Tax=Salinicola lusitanus TaxID=1949085 RepID=UPI000DA22D1D|nr:tape measure protein [Salinicola lusitanus]
MDGSVGTIWYEVDGRTEGLLRAQRDVDSSSKRIERSLGRGDKASRRLGASFDATATSGFRLKGIVSAITAALSVRQIISYADAWTRTQNQLRQVTSGTRELTAVNRELLAVANRSAINIEDTAELYTKVARATRGLGYEQENLTRFVDLTSKSLRANGASAQGASALILQLSQSFNAGILQGQEFNTIMDQAPLLLDALRVSTGKSTIELKKLGAEGKLSTNQLIKAVLSYSKTIDKEAGQATNSFSDSLTIARNNMISFMGSSESAQGVIGNLGQSVVTLSNHVDGLAASAVAIAGVIAGRYANALGAGAIAHLALAGAAVRQAAADRDSAQASLQATRAHHQKAIAASNAARSTIAEIEADRAYYAAALASAKTTGQKVAIRRQLVEVNNALTAAEGRLAAANSTTAASGAAVASQQAKTNAVMKSTGVVAKGAAVAVGGLRTALALLGGPVGILIAVGSALVLFRDDIEKLHAPTQRAKTAVEGLTEAFDKNSRAALQNGLSQMQTKMIGLQQAARDARDEIDSINDRYNVPGPLRNSSSADDAAGKARKSQFQKLRGINEETEITQRAIDQLQESLKALGEDDDSGGGGVGTGGDGGAADKSFQRIKQQLESERETIEREYAERNKIIQEHTSKGSAQQQSLLKRSGDLRAREMQSLNDRLAGINATGIQQINQQYDEQHREILDITEAGSDEQMQALIKNQSARQKALKEYHDQELGDLRSATSRVEAEYAKRRQKVIDNTRMGGQEQRDMLLKVEQQKQVDMLNAQAQELASVQNHQQAMKDAELAYQTARIQQLTGFTQQVSAKLAEFQQNAAQPMKFLGDSLAESFVNLDDTVSSTFVNAMSRGEGLNDILAEIGRTVVASLLQSFIKLGVQMAINAAMGSAYQSAAAATAAATGATIAASYAPAAAMVSLATMGSNAIPAAAALSSTTALASGLAVAGGRQYGGGVNAGSMYRVTEDGKPEMYSDGTRSYLLPGRNGTVTSNRDMQSGGGGVPGVTVQLYGQGAENARVSQSEGPNREQIIQIMLEDAYENGPVRRAYGV